jgi:hypothetical protein
LELIARLSPWDRRRSRIGDGSQFPKKECEMSNESNREANQTISPSELQASDFFPPGTGWNKDDSSCPNPTSRERERLEEDTAVDGARPH